MTAWAALIVLLATRATAGADQQNILANPGFEQALVGWSGLATQDPGAGQVSAVQTAARSGTGCLRIEHRGAGGWTYEQPTRFPVNPGDILRLGGWVRTEGLEGTMAFTPVLRNAAGDTLDWPPCKMAVNRKPGWQLVVRRLLVCPPNAQTLTFQVSGKGICASYLDDVFLVREANLNAWRDRYAFSGLDLENGDLHVRMDKNLSMVVVDKRSGRRWEQQACLLPWAACDATTHKGAAAVRLRNVLTGSSVLLDLALRDSELDVSLTSSHPDIPLEGECAFPFTFQSQPGDFVHVSGNAERAVPVSALAKRRELGSSAWCGVSDGKAGYLILTATPGSGSIRVQPSGPQADGLLSPSLVWLPEDGTWAYPRRATYVFLADGGQAAMERRARQAPTHHGL